MVYPQFGEPDRKRDWFSILLGIIVALWYIGVVTLLVFLYFWL